MLSRTVRNLANIYFASSHVWKQIFSQVFQNLIPADTLVFVVKITVYKEKCPQACNRETSFLSAESVETRYRSKHQGHYSLHKQTPLPTPLKDVGEVTHGNMTHNNTAYYGAFHWESKMNMLNVYFALYIKLPVATWLFWATTKTKAFFIQCKQWSICHNQIISYLPLKFGLSQARQWEETVRGGDQGTTTVMETWEGWRALALSDAMKYPTSFCSSALSKIDNKKQSSPTEQVKWAFEFSLSPESTNLPCG